MNWRAPFSLLILGAFTFAASGDLRAENIAFKKTVVDKVFRAEGIAVGDVNHDGKQDLLAGEFWYEAPEWKPHELSPPGDYKDGAGGYSQCFACWADDMNADGWVDFLVVGFPGAPCHWLENPQNKPGHWARHVVAPSACNESPQYVDLLGTGQRVLLLGHNEQEMVYYSRPANATEPWQRNQVSEPGKKAAGTAKYDHGLGAGDVNGDGRLDVLCTAGWYEQPAKVDGKTAWQFHAAPLSQPCADMHVYDLDGNGTGDILSSSAHNIGIWAALQQKGSSGSQFVAETLFPKLFSQSHALQCVDVNGDGLRDFVTGKRRWAHGPKGDIDPMAAPVLFWFEAQKSPEGVVKFVPQPIDDSSGIGTQFWTGDLNGDQRLDIAVANKMGVYVFEQVRTP